MSDQESINIAKIVEDDMRTLDAMPTDFADIMVPRAQYRAMLIHIRNLEKLWDGLALSHRQMQEMRDGLRADLRRLIEKHGI